MISARTTLSAVAAVTAVLALSGCASEHTSADHGQGGHTEGHDGAAAAGDGMTGHAMPEVSAPPDGADWNTADAEYLTMMVAHHSQALDLAELAPDRASDPRVLRLAEAIDVGQGREIVMMATWLVQHGQAEPTPESVAHMTSMGMPGMLTGAQLDALAETDGQTFDRTFLEDMIQHHQGAVAMAEDVMVSGRDQRVNEIATDVVAGQGAEISRMRDLLEQLPAA